MLFITQASLFNTAHPYSTRRILIHPYSTRRILIHPYSTPFNLIQHGSPSFNTQDPYSTPLGGLASPHFRAYSKITILTADSTIAAATTTTDKSYQTYLQLEQSIVRSRHNRHHCFGVFLFITLGGYSFFNHSSSRIQHGSPLFNTAHPYSTRLTLIQHRPFLIQHLIHRLINNGRFI